MGIILVSTSQILPGRGKELTPLEHLEGCLVRGERAACSQAPCWPPPCTGEQSAASVPSVSADNAKEPSQQGPLGQPSLGTHERLGAGQPHGQGPGSTICAHMTCRDGNRRRLDGSCKKCRCLLPYGRVQQSRPGPRLQEPLGNACSRGFCRLGNCSFSRWL